MRCVHLRLIRLSSCFCLVPLLTSCPTGGAAAEHLEYDADTLGVRDFAVVPMSSSTWLPLPQIPGLCHTSVWVHVYVDASHYAYVHTHTITGPESPLISPHEEGMKWASCRPAMVQPTYAAPEAERIEPLRGRQPSRGHLLPAPMQDIARVKAIQAACRVVSSLI